MSFSCTVHHIVFDGWSHSYSTRSSRPSTRHSGTAGTIRCSRMPGQYADFTLWQRRSVEAEDLERGLGYWTQQLRGAPDESTLPRDRPRPPKQTFGAKMHSLALSPSQWNALNDFARARGVTLYMALLTAFAVLLSRYSGQRDIVVGSPSGARRDPRLHDLIGLFVNVLVMRVMVQPSDTFESLLASVKHTTRDAYRHQDVPFERVVEALAPPRAPDRAAVFQIVFALQNAPSTAPRLSGLIIEAVCGGDLRFDRDLEVQIWQARPTAARS